MIAGLHLRKADAFFIGKIDVDAAFQILEKTDSDAFDFYKKEEDVYIIK